MTVRDIITAYLQEHGYDGLCSPGNCGCEISDLVPCSEDPTQCEPGYKEPCSNECRCGDGCWGDDNNAWHIITKRPQESKP